MTIVVKVLKNGLGEWAVWWGGEKATRLAYRRFFKEKETAERWAEKFKSNMGIR
jgi:hypothetical protein